MRSLGDKNTIDYQSRQIALTGPSCLSTLAVIEVHFRPETESRLTELASKSGRTLGDLLEDALAGYLIEVAEVREMLDSRYDEIKSGQVKPIDGEAFFDCLRQRENELQQLWREAMGDKTPGVPVKEVLDRLERKYRDLANKAK